MKMAMNSAMHAQITPKIDESKKPPAYASSDVSEVPVFSDWGVDGGAKTPKRFCLISVEMIGMYDWNEG